MATKKLKKIFYTVELQGEKSEVWQWICEDWHDLKRMGIKSFKFFETKNRKIFEFKKDAMSFIKKQKR